VTGKRPWSGQTGKPEKGLGGDFQDARGTDKWSPAPLILYHHILK
jgi:hypothetical protein